MALNKKGQWALAGMMIFITGFIVLVNFIPILKPQIVTIRDSDHLDCTNSSITTGQKMTCVVVDVSLFYFIGIGIAALGGYVTGKKIQYKYAPPDS